MENNNPIRVLLLSPLPPPVGGITSWTKEYCAKIPEYGCTVDVINTSVTGDRINNDRNISYIGEFKRIKKIRAGMLKQLKKQKYDVIHYNSSCFTLGLIKDYYVLRGVKKIAPIVFQCHCNLETNIRNSFSKNLLKSVFDLCNCVLVLNQKSLCFAKKYSTKVIKIPNFIDRVYCEKKECREKLADIVFVGRVSKQKGIYELLEAMTSFPEINLHIIGPDNSGILKDIDRKNIRVYGSVDHERVIKVISGMDAFILPSYSEGFPLVILEAMACGLPIIATDVGSITEMMGDGGGVIVPPHDIDSISKAIEMIKRKPQRELMSKKNIETVQRFFVEDVVMKNLTEIYTGMKNGK